MISHIHRRAFLQTAAGVAAGLSAPQINFGASSKPPNIVYIMADDHSSHAIGAYGSYRNRTPNIDRLADGGMRFDSCLCTNSICTPSRAVILTGQYSHITGVKTLADRLDPNRQTVAKLLQHSGYQTAIVGKWHLVSDPQGFDYWNILPGQGVYNDPVLIEMGTRKQHPGYVSDIIANLSLDWLRQRDKKKPFFLMCHHKAPHRPWDPNPKYANLYNGPIPEPCNLYDHYEHRSRAAALQRMTVGINMNKRDFKMDPPPSLEGDALRKWGYHRYLQDYLRCVASVDDNVGRVLDYLDKEKLAENTVVIYTSDQGMFLGEHGYFDKRFMYEESLRMPFLIRYPREIKPGSTNNDIVLNLDFAELFLDFAGQKTPDDMQGRSFRPLLHGKTPDDWRTSMYYRYWMHLSDHAVPAHYGIRTKRYKLIYYYGQPLDAKGAVQRPTEPEWEMFDLATDPNEMYDVHDDPVYATAKAELTTELSQLQTKFKDTPWNG